MSTKLGKILADFTTSLATALAIGGTSATLQSATDDDGVALPTGRYFFTLDGGNSSKEHISCDLNGTALTNIKTVTRQGVESAGVARVHRIGTTVTLTDFAHIKFINDLLSGATQLDSANPLSYDGAATINGNNQLATKAYVDSVASGSAQLTNIAIIEDGIAGETIAAEQLIYFSEADNEWMKCDADNLATLFNVKLGIAQGSGTNGNAITGGVLTRGQHTTTGLTQGDLVYAGNTAGSFVSGTPGTVPRVIGIAKSTTILYFDPDFQNRLYDYAVDAVGSDAYAVTLAGGLSVPFVGMQIAVKFGTANTGAATLAVNGGSALAIVKGASTALETGDVLANMIGLLRYNGTGWQLLNPRVIDGATQVTGVIPIGNLASQAFQQAIPGPIQATTTARASGSNATGSVIYAVHDHSTELYRYERDAITGQYFQTHAVNMTAVIPAGDTGSIIEIGIYIYVFLNDNTNIIARRYLAADLTGEQTMTVPTVACVGQVTAWTDGVAAYVVSTNSDTTLRKWTITGTTFTADSTSSITGSIFAEANMVTMFDGITQYVCRVNGATVTIYKLTTVLAATYSTTTKTIPAISDADGGAFIANIDTTRLYIGKTSVNYDEAAIISSSINLFPITKP